MSSDVLHELSGFWRTALCGSEEQKQKYLPSLAKFSTVACWVSKLLLAHSHYTCLVCNYAGFQLLYIILISRLWLNLTMEVMQVLCKQQQPRFELLTSCKLFTFLFFLLFSWIFCCLVFALILGYAGWRWLDTWGPKTLDRKQYFCWFACYICSEYHHWSD